ncbi:RDD family protein [Flammeovirga sp. SJP92]|uniref:RDD family protein n=1 Tax=Flammeovirga sp. SJP92 TaxID=1775430 RepID=UPI000786AC6D|nr:RDD family protein [Flammeovirga sp. SJP92]KXX68729.1 hypothetical protein AVL50_18830 [Flammeovirga sp. SJP92]
MSSISFQNSQNVNLQFQKALVTTRIAAFIIDMMLISAIMLLPGMILTYTSQFAIFWVVIMSIPFLFYNLICEIFLEGQSLGKKALKIRVVSMDGNATKLSQYFIRWIFRLIDIALLQGTVAVFTILMKGEGQRLGDILAGTIVISEKRKVDRFTFQIPEFPEDYEPVFVTADTLNDKQLNVIKKTLKLKNTEDHYTVIHQIAEKLKEQLLIESDLQGRDFLKQLVDDYYYLTVQSQKESY